MQTLFGRSLEDYDRETALESLPKVHVELAHKVVAASGALEMIAQWKTQARKSNAGRKPLVSMDAVLVLFVAHALAGKPLTYTELARTLEFRLKHDLRNLVGVTHKRGTHDQWYDRMWAATNRLVELFDPYPGPRNVRLKGAAWENFFESTQQPAYIENTERMLDRMDELLNKILHASLHLVPRDIWEQYLGNLLIDATKVEVAGTPNSASSRGSRSNPDPLSGRYTRKGSHGGTGARTDVAAYELETACTMWNKPGENDRFPTLVTAVSMHRPGKLVGHAARLIGQHKRLGYDRFLVTVDRAYNGEKIENFHIPVRLAGGELVLEYKKTDLGLQGWFEDLILVDGNWYVNWMPIGLIQASQRLRALEDAVSGAMTALSALSHSKDAPTRDEQIAEHRQTIDDAPAQHSQLINNIKNRERYRMKEHGLVDRDGAQRFRYPDPERSLVPPRPLSDRASITIPMLVPEIDAPKHLAALVTKPKGGTKGNPSERRKPQPIKHVQKYAYQSAEWHRYKGTRSLVEASNRLLKKATKFDIEEPDLRSGRGYAFTYLATALAVVAENLLRIRSFFQADAERQGAPKTRARRRKDPQGNSLPRRQPIEHGPPS
ncbi:hypothetical protein GE115_12595 [Agromyces sp. CFH 90414]|uniref:Uncharacterized protein n=1 Tax=Agromyces agglutinans TaxID=2662258 RepID=A0A6I2F8N3_9MICO|nr:hypothetical protein [Agromyces agglutinans]MRG60701.1 hypothetical protein [Agromyces agglutinans]